MAINDYTLNWSNNSLKPPFVVEYKAVDDTTTSLTLTGKGTINWGEKIEENLLHLLENFASPTPPLHPTLGQQWFDTANAKLMVFDGLTAGWQPNYQPLRAELNAINSAIAPTTSPFETIANHNTDIAIINAALLSNARLPVGFIFMSVSAANPATMLGYGTWVAFGTGRMPVAIDAAQSEFDTVRETGGAKTHALSLNETASHAHAIVDPGHSHTVEVRGGYESGTWAYPVHARYVVEANNVTRNAYTGISVSNAGGGAAHNNLPPYIVVYMWERTS